jgi:hypothetical protein
VCSLREYCVCVLYVSAVTMPSAVEIFIALYK